MGIDALPIPAYQVNVGGDTAAGSTDSSNPVSVGGLASASAPAVSAGQRVRAYFDVSGRLHVVTESVQTATAVLYTQAETAIGSLVHGSAFTLPAATRKATINIFYAAVATTAPGVANNRPVSRVVVQGLIAGTDDRWVDIPGLVFSGNTAAAVTTTIATSNVTAGAATITTAGSATFGSLSSLLYVRDSATAGEWLRQQSHVTTTINVPSPGSVNAHVIGANIYDQALRWSVPDLDVGSLSKLRLEVDNNQQATGPTISVYAEIKTMAA